MVWKTHRDLHKFGDLGVSFRSVGVSFVLQRLRVKSDTASFLARRRVSVAAATDAECSIPLRQRLRPPDRASDPDASWEAVASTRVTRPWGRIFVCAVAGVV